MAYEEITPVGYPITLTRNDDWNREIEIFQSDGVTGWNFAGWSAKAQVREDDTSGSTVSPTRNAVRHRLVAPW